MFGLLDFLKIGVGAVAGLALGYLVGHEFGSAAGRTALQSEQAAAAAVVERERVIDDARLRGLSDRDLCVRALRARGMPDATCNGLRRLP